MNDTDREHLIQNVADHMKGVTKDIQEKAVKISWKIDPDYGARVTKAVGVKAPMFAKM